MFLRLLTACLFVALSFPVAAKNFSDYFSLVPARGDSLSKSLLTANEETMLFSLDRGALEMRFLLLPTVITTSEHDANPGFSNSLVAKRVFFKKVGKSLYLMEDMAGYAVSPPFEPEKILAEFPIVSENDERIAFDFKAGFDRIIYEADAIEAAYERRREQSVSVSASYLRDPIAVGDLFGIWHVAQVGGENPATLTFSYAFVPERSSSSFKPVPPPGDLSMLGYFLSPPVYEQAGTEPQQFAARWDLKKSVVFSISSNTPPEFRDAVKEGIEAWNKAFGRNVVVAQDAPEGVIIGDPRYNIVQWIERDDVASARADFHIHPLTGEILHANVLLLSGWAAVSQEDATLILQHLDEREEVAKGNRFGLHGFESISLCDQQIFEGAYREFLEAVVSGEVPADRVLSLAQKAVTATVAHEIGHDFGLRHNFAGNLGSEFSSSEEREDFSHLLLEGTRLYEDRFPSSSVMDYLDFSSDVRMIEPGIHDRAAIRWGYLASDEQRGAMWLPPFCTDENVQFDADCQKWDAWADPLEWRVWEFQKQIRWFNDDLITIISGENGDDPQIRWVDWMVGGFINYLRGDMRVHSLGGKTAEARQQQAAVGLAPYLWSDAKGAAPVGALVTDELIFTMSEFENGPPPAEVMGIIIQEHDKLVSMILAEIGGPEGMSIVPHAIGPFVDPLVELAANAGTDSWFSDAEEHRLTSTQMIVSLAGAGGEDVMQRLREKLFHNIDIFEKLISGTSDPQEREALEARRTFEQELLSLVSDPRAAASRASSAPTGAHEAPSRQARGS